MNFKTADLCDDFSNELEVCTLEFKSYGKKTSFYGPLYTVKVFEDNVLVKEALEDVPAGSVLVVDGGGSKRCALLGDRLGEIAERRGLAGVIINGCVRDTAELKDLHVGILAIGSNPLKSKKEGKGERNVPVIFGEVEWTPGKFAYADEDGVIVSNKKLF
ncbi:S-adenosylmethionine--2-demethylmenaquinone methyltransferase [Bacillus methanolicus]|uniref:ribonuclease E activity regulator RraA n=1 Tax=Bacillus methanolicus TaxID=1471 RepID=UPI00200EA5EC|nr:ribonuclease E activity regulator RraA [Bacillus methanolicus]UQD51158.1 S-adenosylmethionine--2-demethylmenaquinone methyltransferase [Bacillus methanolicus]